MKHGRDNQREKCYRAEREALWPITTALPTVKDVERYLKRQSKRATLVSRYGRAVNLTEHTMEIKDGRGRRNACAFESYAIALPLWARSDVVALHEWAHVIHKRLNWSGAMLPENKGTRTAELSDQYAAAHGWQWAAIFLDLVTFCIGREAAAAFKTALRKHHVRFKPKRQRSAPVDREAMIARMAKARAARAMTLAA